MHGTNVKIIFSMTALMPLATTHTLILVYFAYFHTIMSFGVLFWGKSTDFKRTFAFKKSKLLD